MKKVKLSTLVIISSLFIFFLFLAFPFENLKGLVFSKIYDSTGILVVSDDMSLTFFGWPGVSLRNVNVTIPLGQSELELASEKTVFRIGLAGIFPPAPSVTMNLRKLKKGGDLYVKFSKSGNVFSGSVDASDLNLAQIQLPGLTQTLEGKIGSDSYFKVDQSDLSKSSGKIEIKGSGFQTPAQMIEGMPGMAFAIPGLTIGKIDAVVTLKNGTAEFTNIKLGDSSSDLSGSVTGELKLGQDILRSRLNLTLRLHLSNKITQDPQNKTFVSFLEGYQLNPGEYGMKWNAMISELTGLSIKVLPDKLTN